ncbi:MAG: tetratricopeptide repeat protein [Thermodesulfobacteria bacterium]|nr:tetratricopeptide repeat protein [Thermodesulfobacteriota bacterium]
MKKTQINLIIIAFFLLFYKISFALTNVANPVHIQDLIKQGITQYREENFEEALQIFLEVEKEKPSTFVDYYLGLCYKQVGDYEKAKEYFIKAIKGSPPVLDAYVELINILYQLGELKAAKYWLVKAEKLKIFPAKIAFLKGLILFRDGDFKEARKAFKKAKSLDKSFSAAADFQIALTYLKERRLNKAKKLLERIVKTSPTYNLKDFAKQYIELITKIQKNYKSIRWTLSTGLGYDSNVVSKPSETIGIPTVDEISHKSDWAIQGDVKVSYTPLIPMPFYFDSRYEISGKDYFHKNTYNSIVQSLSLTPGYTFSNGIFILPISADYAIVYKHAYSFALSIAPTVNFGLKKTWILQVGTEVRKRDILRYPPGVSPDEDRDGIIYKIFVNANKALYDNNGLWFTRILFEKDDTQGKNWRSHIYGLGSGIVIPINSKLKLIGIANLNIVQFEKENEITIENAQRISAGLAPIPGFPTSPTKRKDTVYSISFGTSYQLLKFLILNFNVSYTKNKSNFKIYTFDRYTTLMEVQTQF